jgi:hypothetical protein
MHEQAADDGSAGNRLVLEVKILIFEGLIMFPAHLEKIWQGLTTELII